MAVGWCRAATRKQLGQSERQPVDNGYLFKDRMDITGTRWGLEQAEASLKLRSLKVRGNLAAYLAFHFEQEHKRHYPGPPIPLAESEAV